MAHGIAKQKGLTLVEDHWLLIRALQEYYSKAERPILRQIKDALEERFHGKGGMKYLYEICPGGPVAEGCVSGRAGSSAGGDRSLIRQRGLSVSGQADKRRYKGRYKGI